MINKGSALSSVKVKWNVWSIFEDVLTSLDCRPKENRPKCFTALPIKWPQFKTPFCIFLFFSWVVCEHTNYRGRQFLLEQIEIPNWLKFSSLETIGSLYPVRQVCELCTLDPSSLVADKDVSLNASHFFLNFLVRLLQKQHYFRIKNKERGHFMSVQGGVEEMKSGRVVVTPEVEPMSDIWFYQDGFIKNKVSPSIAFKCRRRLTTWRPIISISAGSPRSAGHEHEPPSYGQRRAGSQGRSVDGDPAAHPDVDGSDDRPRHQPHFPRHGAGRQRYRRIFLFSLLWQKVLFSPLRYLTFFYYRFRRQNVRQGPRGDYAGERREAKPAVGGWASLKTPGAAFFTLPSSAFGHLLQVIMNYAAQQ